MSGLFSHKTHKKGDVYTMKKPILIVTVILLAVLCILIGMFISPFGNFIKHEIKSEINEAKGDIAEEISEISDYNSLPPESSQSAENIISEEEAKQIALNKAEITADGVFFDRVDLEKDDGIWKYEIAFRKDRTEYDIDINAENGEIVSWEIDTDD